MASDHIYNPEINKRFRGYCPVVIDVETGGINPQTDALLEIAAVTLNYDAEGKFSIAETFAYHIMPDERLKMTPESMAINKIDPYHPFRFAISEGQALDKLFTELQRVCTQSKCNRCVLVGHNAWFDLAFLNAAIARCKIKKNPFHAFTCFDTATLSGVAYGHTVLAESLKRAEIEFDNNEHHSAIYDAQRTAELFCKIVNQWPKGLSF